MSTDSAKPDFRRGRAGGGMMDALLESPQGDAAFRALMLSPAVTVRRKVKRAPRVERPAVVLVTLADRWYASPRGKRDRGRKHPLTESVPTYSEWLRKAGLKPAQVKQEADRARLEWATIRATL